MTHNKATAPRPQLWLLSELPSCTTSSRPAFTDPLSRLSWASHLLLLERKSCRLEDDLCYAMLTHGFPADAARVYASFTPSTARYLLVPSEGLQPANCTKRISYTAQYTYRSSPCEVQRDLCSIGRLQGLGLLKSLATHNVTSTPPCNDFLPSMYRSELRLHGQVSMELKAQLEHSN